MYQSIAKWFFLWLLMVPALLKGQVLEPVKWQFEAPNKPVKIGETIELVFKAKIDKGWYLYGNDFSPDLGPLLTTFEFKKNSGYELIGKPMAINPKKKFDDIFGGEYSYFTKSAEFRQKVKVLSEGVKITGTWDGQTCTEADGKCININGDFSFDNLIVEGNDKSIIGSGNGSKPLEENLTHESSSESNLITSSDASNTAKDSIYPGPEGDKGLMGKTDTSENIIESATSNTTQVEGADSDSLFGFFFLAFGSGLLALLTPCVFPMIPMTVSYFTKGSQKEGGKTKALFFGGSIILIYTVLGTLLARFNGPEAANFLSTHWLPNLLFFGIFVVFGISFLGAFELVLPSKWVNAADKQADKGGYYGVFFMAFTLALVSFSCTGPIVGLILVQSAGGEVLKPVTGMFGYSLAFAIPFTLFAVFPNWLSNLPRSGGWLNVVKVVLGFLELALALKFLSIADQAYHWRILDREVFLALWIVIFALMAFYLLGKIKLSHDSEMTYIPIPRLLLATGVLGFVVYLIPGLWGAPLKALSGYLPPLTTQDFVRNQANVSESGANHMAPTGICEPVRYSDFLKLPHNLKGYFTIKEAEKCSKEQGKPVFVDFTGHGCVNCRKMEEYVWSDPKVLKLLQEEFVIASLYVDDKTELPQSEWYVSTYDQKEKTTLGKQNADYQVRNYGSNAQPLYAIQDAEGKSLVTPVAYDPDVEKFVAFLKSGVEKFKQKQSASSR